MKLKNVSLLSLTIFKQTFIQTRQHNLIMKLKIFCGMMEVVFVGVVDVGLAPDEAVPRVTD